MTDFPFAIVGFDLDGTLVDTSRDLANAANAALAAAGRPPLPDEAVIARVGGGTRDMLSQVLAASGGSDAELIDRLLPVLLDHYERHVADASRPYPGVEATLDALKARGVTLAVVTNKVERLSVALLKKTGLLNRFACVIGGDSVPPEDAKPAPGAIRTMMERIGAGRAAFVGDSAYDVRAARSAGIPVIACRFGFSGDAVETLGADAVIDDYASLLPALEAL